MQGLLADVNVQGHLPYLRILLEALSLWGTLAEAGVSFATFRDLGLDRHLDDRSLWELCQQQGWVLLTENRNHDGPDSLQGTLETSWRVGLLPVLTLANKGRFEHNSGYAKQVAGDVADILFGIRHGREYCDRPRIYLPLANPS